MNKYMALLEVVLLFSSVKVFGHKEWTHQYLSREAYNLLREQRDLTSLYASYFQGSQYGPPTHESITLVDGGTYVEDQRDIIWGYCAPEIPFYGCQGASNSHFWDPDNPIPTAANHLVLGIWIDGYYHNALDKAKIFWQPNRNITMPGPWNFQTMSQERAVLQAEGISTYNTYLGMIIRYDNLPAMARTHSYSFVGIVGLNGEIMFSHSYSVTSIQADFFAASLLGRIAHLLGDMNVPAHVKTAPHPCPGPFNNGSRYEMQMGGGCDGPNQTFPAQSYIHSGSLLNILSFTDPMKALFYTTAQIADCYPEWRQDGSGWQVFPGDRTYSNIDPITGDDYSQIFSDVIPNIPASFPNWDAQFENEAQVSMRYTIRAIATLYYWFGMQSGGVTTPDIIVKNDFNQGTVIVNGISYATGSLFSNFHISDPLTVEVTNTIQNFGGYVRHFTQWQKINPDFSIAGSFPFASWATSVTGSNTFNAAFDKECNVSFANNLAGVGNAGRMKINGVEYELPHASFPVIENRGGIQAEALHQVFDGVEYVFHHWDDGSTQASRTFDPHVHETHTAYLNALIAPTNVAAQALPSHILLSWNGVEGAHQYKIYRNGTALATTSNLSYLDNVPSYGTSYSYNVSTYIGSYESVQSPTINAQAVHLASSSPAATLSSSQRHLVFGAPVNEAWLPLYAGYQTNDRIFLTYSTDLGATWSSEKHLGEGNYVSLVPDVLGGTGGTQGVVWETPPANGMRNIGFVTWNPFSGTFSRYATIASGIPLSIASHPVVSFFQGWVCVVWADQDGLKYRVTGYNPMSWGPAVPVPSSTSADRMPSLSLSPALYMVYINDWAVYLRRLNVASGSPPQLQWTTPSMVRGSDEMNSAVAQVQGEDFTFNNQYYHQAHVVWQSPVDETANVISYQRFSQSGSVTSGSWLTTVRSWQGAGFRNPSVSVFADGNLSVMWSNAQYLFRVDRINGTWSPATVVGPGSNVTVAAGYARPSLENQRHLYVNGTPPWYNIRVGPTPWVPPPIDEEQQTDMIATWGEEQEGETLELKLEEPAYDFGQIEFNPPSDTAWYATLEEAMCAFETQEFVVGPPAGPLSNGDSISLGGSVLLRTHSPINKSGKEGGELTSVTKNFRLAFDVLDAESRERLRTVAEVKFSKGGAVKVKQRGSLAGLAGQRVLLRPRLIGFPEQLQGFSATIKRIHKISVGPVANSPLAAISSSSNGSTPGVPTVYALHPSYPNPFNPATTIRFDLPEPATVTLSVYDVLGRLVAELVSEMKEAGYHTASWNAAGNASGVGYASGVYFVRFTATDANGKVKVSKVAKLLLTK